MHSSIKTVIDVRLFGAVELKSQYGCVIEQPEEKPLLFLLLKYLLLEPQREATREEIVRLVWTDSEPKSGASRVRLRRLRKMLEPLQPEEGKEIVTYKAGKYGIHPDYLLRFDTDTFVSLLKQIEKYPLSEPEGLILCKEALELMRGPLMEYSEEVAWLAGYRSFYQREFIRLALNTLNRMSALEDTNAIKLLCSRALMLAPADEPLQRSILRFLTENGLEEELTEHIRLLILTGQAEWLLANINVPEEETAVCDPEPEEDHTVYVRLFGDVELRNEHDHIIENRSRTPLLLLKYLLIKHPQIVSMAEILQLWPPSKAESDQESTLRVRLRRAREALRPLQLDKKRGLILYRDGVFQLNPAYTVKRDVDDFDDLVNKLTDYAEDDPNGLQLGMEAMDLFRGPLMEYTQSEPWLEAYRSYYKDKFYLLANDVLNRTKALKTDEAFPLLLQRAAVIVPEYQDLHEAIIHYLMEQKRELEMIRYLSQLSRSGNANWMEKSLCERSRMNQ